MRKIDVVVPLSPAAVIIIPILVANLIGLAVRSPPEFLLFLPVFLPLWGALLLWGIPKQESRSNWLLIGVPILNLSVCVWILCGLLQAENPVTATLNWNVHLPTIPTRTGFLDQVAWRVDLTALTLLLLLQVVFLTLVRLSLPKTRREIQARLGLLAAISLSVIADDFVSLACGVMLSISLISRCDSRREVASKTTSLFRFPVPQVCGWVLILTGIASLISIAALVRSAPHGLPGHSTTVLTQLAQLIADSTEQHPAARLLWEQYRGFGLFGLLAGVALASGIFPLHEPLIQSLNHSSLPGKLWTIALSKLAFLVGFRLMLESNPEGWEAIRDRLFLPGMLGLLWLSCLLLGTGSDSLRIARMVAWSHQLDFVMILLLPASEFLILMFCVWTQFAALVLLSLEHEFTRSKSRHSSWISKLVGVALLGLSPGGVSLQLLWKSTVALSATESTGRTLWVCFLVLTLISLAGLLRHVTSPTPSNVIGENRGEMTDHALRIFWGSVALLSGFVLPWVSSSF